MEVNCKHYDAGICALGKQGGKPKPWYCLTVCKQREPIETAASTPDDPPPPLMPSSSSSGAVPSRPLYDLLGSPSSSSSGTNSSPRLTTDQRRQAGTRGGGCNCGRSKNK